MDSAIAPKVTEFFEKADGMLPRRLVEPIDRFAQFFLRLMPVVMRDFFLQNLPGRLFGVLFRRVSREVDHSQSAVRFQPFFHFFAGMVRSLIDPQDDFPSRASLKQLFQPTDRRLRVLPVDHKRDDLFPRSQMEGAVNVLGGFASRSVRNEGLLADRIPALCDRSFEINLALIASQGSDLLPTVDQFRKNFRRFKLEASLLGLAPFDIQLAPALIAPVQGLHQFPRPALAIAKVKTFLDQNANRFDGPSAAHLSAWHRFLLKQLTELAQFVRLQVTLAMLPSPARIILQAVQPFLLVGSRPSTDRLFIHEENVGGLPVTVAFSHQQQRMVALPLVTIEFLVFVTSRSFQEVWLAQHCASFSGKVFNATIIFCQRRLHILVCRAYRRRLSQGKAARMHLLGSVSLFRHRVCWTVMFALITIRRADSPVKKTVNPYE